MVTFHPPAQHRRAAELATGSWRALRMVVARHDQVNIAPSARQEIDPQSRPCTAWWPTSSSYSPMRTNRLVAAAGVFIFWPVVIATMLEAAAQVGDLFLGSPGGLRNSPRPPVELAGDNESTSSTSSLPVQCTRQLG